MQNDLSSIRLPAVAGIQIAAAVAAAKSKGDRLRGKDAGAGASPAAEVYGPEIRGRNAVRQVLLEGHQFLGQFVIDQQGHAQWLTTERVLEGATSLFLSGVQNVERKITLERLSASPMGSGLALMGWQSSVRQKLSGCSKGLLQRPDRRRR